MIIQSQRVQKYFLVQLTGTTIKNLSLKTIRNTKIQFPTNEEQKKIADILLNQYQQIQNNKSELKRLSKLKKGLMQDLLSGKVKVKIC